MCCPTVGANIYQQKRRLISEPFAKQQTDAQVTSQHTPCKGAVLSPSKVVLIDLWNTFSWSPEACQPSSDMVFLFFCFFFPQIIQLVRSIWKQLFWCFMSFMWPLIKATERTRLAERLRCPKVVFNALLTFKQISTFFGSLCVSTRSHRGLELWNVCPRGS